MIAFKNNKDPNSPRADLLSYRNHPNGGLDNPNFVLAAPNNRSALTSLVDNFKSTGTKNLLLTPMFNANKSCPQNAPEQQNFMF